MCNFCGKDHNCKKSSSSNTATNTYIESDESWYNTKIIEHWEKRRQQDDEIILNYKKCADCGIIHNCL